MKKAVFCIFFLFIVISFHSCVSVKIGENTNKTKINNNSKFNTKIKDLSLKLIEMGLANKLDDFDGFIWGFTVIDSNNNSIPFANILIDYGNNDIVKISKTDENGQFKLAFTLEAINKNPLIYAKSAGKYYGVEWKMTAETDTDKGIRHTTTINLSDLKNVIINNKDILYYSSDLENNTITFGKQILEKQRKFIESFTGLYAIPFGIAIVNKESPLNITPDISVVNGLNIKVFPYSYNPARYLNISNTNIHEWTEQTLIKTYGQTPRFFSDGLSTFIEYPFYYSLSEQEKSELNFVNKNFSDYLIKGLKLFNEAMMDSTFDLYNWQYPNKDYKFQEMSQAAGYAISASFWNDVLKENNNYVIKNLLLFLINKGTISHEDILSALLNVTNKDYSNLLKNYPLSRVNIYLNSLIKDLNR